MEPLRRCFRCIEVLASSGAPRTVWQRGSRNAFDAIECLLTPTDRLARRWPGARAGHPSRRIVDYGDGRAAAICDQELSPPLALTSGDRVMFRADERRLRKLLADTLDLVISRDDIRRLPGVMRIGDWSPKPAAQFPVTLAVAATPAHLAELVVQETATAVHPMIVFTPTRAMWSARSEAVALPDKVALVPLAEVLDWSDGSWMPSSGWDDYLGAFVQRAGIKLPPGFSTIRKKMRVSKASATGGKIKAEVKQWYGPARKHLLDSGTLLPAPELKDIAKACGVDQSTVSRWLNGKYREKDKELMLLWRNIDDSDFVRTYRQ